MLGNTGQKHSWDNSGEFNMWGLSPDFNSVEWLFILVFRFFLYK